MSGRLAMDGTRWRAVEWFARVMGRFGVLDAEMTGRNRTPHDWGVGSYIYRPRRRPRRCRHAAPRSRQAGAKTGRPSQPPEPPSTLPKDQSAQVAQSHASTGGGVAPGAVADGLSGACGAWGAALPCQALDGRTFGHPKPTFPSPPEAETPRESADLRRLGAPRSVTWALLPLPSLPMVFPRMGHSSRGQAHASSQVRKEVLAVLATACSCEHKRSLLCSLRRSNVVHLRARSATVGGRPPASPLLPSHDDAFRVISP